MAPLRDGPVHRRAVSAKLGAAPLPIGTTLVNDSRETAERRDALRGILSMLLCVLIFGLMDALVKLAAERHPIGAWALEWTRAQVALMRPEPHARAMGEITRDLIETRAGATYFAKRIAGVWQRYDLGPGHPLVGKSAPDLAFQDGARLGAYLQPGRAVLFRFGSPSDHSVVEEQERFRLVCARCVEPAPAPALLVRPDGYIAWAGDEDEDGDGLATAFHKWLGVAAEPVLTPDLGAGASKSSDL